MIIVCKPGATLITFEDIPNANSVHGTIPSTYKGLNWTNGNYLNATAYPSTGYQFVRVSGEYVAWFNYVLTIQTLVANSTFILNSCVMAAGWADVQLTIVGYYSTTQLYTTAISLNTHSQNVLILDWPGVNTVVFTPYSSGYPDTGIDNLCITF